MYVYRMRPHVQDAAGLHGRVHMTIGICVYTCHYEHFFSHILMCSDVTGLELRLGTPRASGDLEYGTACAQHPYIHAYGRALRAHAATAVHGARAARYGISRDRRCGY